MPRWIELHDSVIEALDPTPTTLEIRLSAYIHDWSLIEDRWRGVGVSQRVVMHLHGASIGVEPTVPLPIGIAGGAMRAGGKTHEDMIRVPFAASGRVEVRLELVDGNHLALDGDGIEIEVTGEPEVVEDLPEDTRPLED